MQELGVDPAAFSRAEMALFHSFHPANPAETMMLVEDILSMREECLIPKQEQRLILRELNCIDRAIGRKTRLLLKMQDASRARRKDRFVGTQPFP
jgi:hypothetical protein